MPCVSCLKSCCFMPLCMYELLWHVQQRANPSQSNAQVQQQHDAVGHQLVWARAELLLQGHLLAKKSSISWLRGCSLLVLGGRGGFFSGFFLAAAGASPHSALAVSCCKECHAERAVHPFCRNPAPSTSARLCGNLADEAEHRCPRRHCHVKLPYQQAALLTVCCCISL